MATINKIKVGSNTYDLSASGNYLPLSGGTMTGDLTIANATFTMEDADGKMIQIEPQDKIYNYLVTKFEQDALFGSGLKISENWLDLYRTDAKNPYIKLYADNTTKKLGAHLYFTTPDGGALKLGNTSGTDTITCIGQTGIITATQFKKSGGTSSQFLKADGSVDSNSYLTSASLSSYAKTSDLSKYIPLAGSAAITGGLIPLPNKNCNLGSGASSWINAYLSTIYTDDIHANSKGTDIDIYSDYTYFYTYEGDPIADVRYDVDGYTLNVYKNAGDSSVSISEDKITIYDANNNDSIIIDGDSQEVRLGSNQITTQNAYLALKLRGNELCLGNNTTTSPTNLVVNYRSITGCGTFAGFILRAGSDTSLANLECGALTATSVKLSSGTANQVLMANGSVRNAHSTSGNFGIYNAIPFIKSDGVMEVGKYIDFHQTDTGIDYDTRITCDNGLTVSKAVTAPAFYQTSDIRKKDIKEEISLDKCYDLIDKCQTIIYSLKDQTKEQIGMIAQEVEEFFPEVIQTDEEGFKSLDYSRLVVICFKVLKDLIKRVSKLEEK